MKSYLPLLTFAILLASCSSVYKSGQTPDDVYFSPQRQHDEYVRVENNDDRRYQNEELDREDRYLRMKVANRRYGLLEDYDYYTYNGPDYYRYNNYYRINTYSRYSNPWMWNTGYTFANNNPYYYNPYYCNPYFTGVVYGNTNPKYNKPRTSTLNVYDGNGNSYNPRATKGNSRTFNNAGTNENYRSSGNNAGGFLRDAFGSNSNSSSNTNKTSTSSSNNNSSSNSGSSSSSSSGSSRAPVRKF